MGIQTCICVCAVYIYLCIEIVAWAPVTTRTLLNPSVHHGNRVPNGIWVALNWVPIILKSVSLSTTTEDISVWQNGALNLSSVVCLKNVWLFACSEWVGQLIRKFIEKNIKMLHINIVERAQFTKKKQWTGIKCNVQNFKYLSILHILFDLFFRYIYILFNKKYLLNTFYFILFWLSTTLFNTELNIYNLYSTY